MAYRVPSLTSVVAITWVKCGNLAGVLDIGFGLIGFRPSDRRPPKLRADTPHPKRKTATPGFCEFRTFLEGEMRSQTIAPH